MNIVIAAHVIISHDAIGNDILQEYLTLKENGYSVFLYAGSTDEFMSKYIISKKKLLKFIKQKDNLLIYHHGTSWDEGQEFIENSKCRVFLKYHNITPPSFFESYSAKFVEITSRAIDQTKALIETGRINKYLADSKFNAQDLVSYGIRDDEIEIVPPFHQIHNFDSQEINTTLLEDMLVTSVNVLVVGRVVPNKGHLHIIESLNRYVKNYDNDIRVNIIGDITPDFSNYFQKIMIKVAENNLSDEILFRGKVTFQDLHTYYLSSHICLIMSEHEGFCVPVLEAQYHYLPIIALSRGAVRETAGEEQLIYDEVDYDMFASAIRIVSKNNDIRRYLVKRGFSNYKSRFETSILENTVLELVKGYS